MLNAITPKNWCVLEETMTEMTWLFRAAPQVPDTSPPPKKKARPNSKREHIIQLICKECTPLQAVKQPVTLESFDQQQALKILLLSDELWLIISVSVILLL